MPEPRLTLHRPTPAEMPLRAALLSDEATMAYNHAWGSTIAFPPDRWPAWCARWLDAPETLRFYRYVLAEGEFVGEAAWHLDEARGLYLADVIIHAAHRGQGYGRRALEMLCAEAARHGLPALHDEIALDNPAVALFLRCGFREIGRSAQAVLLRRDLHP